jgi:OmpA-OmpF porin, OOP family
MRAIEGTREEDMAMFDALIDDVASRFGIGANAGPLVREVLGLMTNSPGGVGGFLNMLKSAGLSSEVASWLGQTNAAPLTAQQVDRALGSNALGAISNRLGVSSAIVSTAVGYALPKMIGLLTPGGAVPASLPAEVTSFLSPVVHHVDTTVRMVTPTPVAQVAPRRIDVYHAPPPPDEPVMTRWLWPLLGALAVLGLGMLLWPTGTRAPAPPVAVAPPPPAPPPTLAPPRLALTNDNGVLHVSGAVHDEETRTSILNALKAGFGADKVQGDIAIDLNRGGAPWLVNFRNAVESLKTPGVQAVFDGNSVNVGGVVGDADRDRIIGSLRNVLGSGLVFGTLANKVEDMVASANSRAVTQLASLTPGASVNDVVAALNQSVINFPTGGSEIPDSMMPLLQKAADILKHVPHGAQIEIAGYTDNTGDAAANVALSQQRADAVRNALIKAGVDPDMLVAKGYGSANPVAGNDLLEGQLRNRRIEYHVLRT